MLHHRKSDAVCSIVTFIHTHSSLFYIIISYCVREYEKLNTCHKHIRKELMTRHHSNDRDRE